MGRSGAYYNEHDPIAAQWLRNLITAGLIASGEVDERDIRLVTPIELRGFVQCHFFAGIGIWSYAARRSGWPDDRPLWSGSCPCQPFSDAGRGDGVDDERHLWPAFQWLIANERPPAVVGEQVASKDGLGWLDLVSADMEGAGYAFGAADLCAAGFGLDWRDTAWREWLQRAVRHCPDPMVAGWLRHFAEWADQSLAVGGQHIRQRLYFVGLADDPRRGWGVSGDAARAGGGGHLNGCSDPSGRLGDRERARLERHAGHDSPTQGRGKPGRPIAAPSLSGGLDQSSSARQQGRSIEGPEGDPWDQARVRGLAGGREVVGLGDPEHMRLDEGVAGNAGTAEGEGGQRGHEPDRSRGDDGAGSPDIGRAPFDWVFCRDGCWRPVESGASPLAHAVAGRVGKLRAIGNGLDAETATGFMSVVGDLIVERFGT